MRTSLTFKILLPVLFLIFAGMGTISTLSYLNTAEALSAITYDEVEKMADSTLKMVSSWIEDRKSNIEVWSSDYLAIKVAESYQRDPGLVNQYNQRLAELKGYFSFYDDILLADTKGNIIAGSSREAINGFTVEDRDYFQGAMQDKLAVGEVIKSRANGNPIFCVAAPVKVHNQIKAILFSIINLNEFSRIFIDPIKFGDSGYGFMYRNDGVVIAHPSKEHILKLDIKKLPFGPGPKGMLGNKNGTITYTFKGVEKMVVQRQHPELGWVVGMGAGTYELAAPARAVRNRSISIGIIALILTGLAIFLVTKTVIKPIKRAASLLSQLSEGELNEKMDYSGDDEVGELATALNVMVTDLEESAELAEQIAKGVVDQNVKVKGSRDKLGLALDHMTSSLQQRAEIAYTIADGDLSCNVEVFSKKDQFGNALSTMVQNLRERVRIAEAISEGDLTIKIVPTSEKDVFGHSLIKMIANLQDIIRKLQHNSKILTGSSEQISDISSELTHDSEKINNESGQIAAATEEMTANINNMATGAQEMSLNIKDMFQASEQITSHISQISATAEEMSANMNTVASAVEEMSASIQEVAKTSKDNAEVTNDAMKVSASTDSTMTALRSAAHEIGKVTEIIKKIAGQTSMLALNATIEAASAGEAGKGFAVVANEIKELATQSADAAEEISSKIEDIQKNTNEAVKAIGNISDTIHTINQSVQNVSRTTSEQARAAEEIAKNVTEVNSGARNIASSMVTISKSSGAMCANISEVASGAGHMSMNAAEAANGTQEMAKSVQEMHNATSANLSRVKQVKSSLSDIAGLASVLDSIANQFQLKDKKNDS
jgi:methyl-accepting chemotaxis protein